MFKSNDVPMWRTTVWINDDDDINDICVIFAALFTRAFWVVNSAIQQKYLLCMGNLRYQLNKWIFGYMNELQRELDRDEYDIWSTRFHANRDGRYNAAEQNSPKNILKNMPLSICQRVLKSVYDLSIFECKRVCNKDVWLPLVHNDMEFISVFVLNICTNQFNQIR